MRLTAGGRALMRWGRASGRAARVTAVETETDRTTAGREKDADDAGGPRLPVYMAFLVIAGLAGLLWFGLIKLGGLLFH